MAQASEFIDTALMAALDMSASRDWADITLAEIAEAADLKLSDFHGVAMKDDLVDAASSYFDRAMSAEDVDVSETPRERLFEVIMLRFEAMEAHRDGLLSMMKYQDKSAARTSALFKARGDSARWALVAAKLDDLAARPFALKTVAVAWVIRKTEHAWRKDDGGDFSRTMAALDRELRAAEDRKDWLSRLPFRNRAASEAETAGASE